MANKSVKAVKVAITNYGPRKAELADAEQALKVVRDALYASCNKCHGHVTWQSDFSCTLDWHDWGTDACSSCTVETSDRTIHTVRTDERSKLGAQWRIPTATARALIDAVQHAEERVRVAKQAFKVQKGIDVIVMKGRKVPLGTVGRVFWFGTWAVGFTTANGEKYFTALDNVEVYDGARCGHEDCALHVEMAIACERARARRTKVSVDFYLAQTQRR